MRGVTFNLVVSDDVRAVDRLERLVQRLMGQYETLFEHGPMIVPESVFESFPFISPRLRHESCLAGKRFEFDVNRTGLIATLGMFDEISFRWYSPLEAHLLPRYRFDQFRYPFNYTVKAVNSVLRLKYGVEGWSGTTHLDIRKILTEVRHIAHDQQTFTAATGTTPPPDDGLVATVEEARSLDSPSPLTEAEYVQLLIDALEYRHKLLQAFLDAQSLYPAIEGAYQVQTPAPTLALSTWEEVSIYQILDLIYSTGIKGNILPPHVALHLRTFPNANQIFHSTMPTVRFKSPDVRRVIEHRRRLITNLLEFREQHDVHLCSFPFLISPLRPRHTFSLKHTFQDVWHRSILDEWQRQLSDGGT